jgi:hypothetical protein
VKSDALGAICTIASCARVIQAIARRSANES